MTHKTYFYNFFATLAASQSDADFLSFAETTLYNLESEGALFNRETAVLGPLVRELRARHRRRGTVGGRSAHVAQLNRVVREFLAYARLTNTTKVFPAFPDRKQSERIDIFPGGMDALYQARFGNILTLATHYLEKVSGTYGAQTGVPVSEAAVWLTKLKKALDERGVETSVHSQAAVAIDAQQLLVCDGLYFAYAGLLQAYYQSPKLAYAFFPFPNSRGKPEDDDNLPTLPPELTHE